MADECIDTLVENIFVVLCHLRVHILQLLVAPLEEAQGVQQFALRDELDEQPVSHVLGNGGKLPNQVRVLLLFVLLDVLVAQFLHLELPLKNQVVELGSVSHHSVLNPVLNVVNLRVELAIQSEDIEQAACPFQGRNQMVLCRLLLHPLVLHLGAKDKTTGITKNKLSEKPGKCGELTI